MQLCYSTILNWQVKKPLWASLSNDVAQLDQGFIHGLSDKYYYVYYVLMFTMFTMFQAAVLDCGRVDAKETI